MTYHPDNFVVWTEIPTTDMDRAIGFYQAVLQTELTVDDTGPNPIAIFRTQTPGSGTAGHIYPGIPAARGAGPTVHFNAPGPLEDSLERVKTAGGTVVSPIITIPAGRFAYCEDLDGNSIGMMERG
ncbi:VOC family protein [Marinibacterium profundimaris]|uniref:Glyoxalase n=1 Tax=Marinibacterium profundimaris TaxID=1679460 RepID=A0A225NTD8_9RHOB|nr:VOC family protein [Marinibacterium profundimaris]OWU78089.1 glyoxalase [Marinibacterium profundimaris]